MFKPNAVAAIASRDGRDSQALLAEAVTCWRKSGARIVGVLAENSDTEGVCSAAFLRDIASGRRFSIQLDAAPAGTSCHLDATGIGEACAWLLPQIDGADIVVLSKFGKTEAAQQGLWAAFSTVAAAGKPLLTTVSPKHAQAWASFAPEVAWLEPDSASIEHWWQAAKAQVPR